ncbi:MAG: alpha/beta hydrolase [Pseudomonadota bacterium]
MPTCRTALGPLHYTFNGVATPGPALVLIHGAGGRAADWPFEWRETASAVGLLGVGTRSRSRWITQYPVYALDLPGHGKSTGLGFTEIGDYADAVVAFVEAMQLPRAVLVGHSMGGAIALDVTLRHGERLGAVLDSLIILGSAAHLPVAPAILEGLTTDFPATVATIVQYCWPEDTTEFYKKVCRRRMLEAGQAVVHGDFLASSRFDVRNDLSRIPHPVLVIAGEAERMVRTSASEKLATGLPNARFVTVPGGGHFFHIDKVGHVTPEVTAFCAARAADAAAHPSPR